MLDLKISSYSVYDNTESSPFWMFVRSARSS